MMANINYKAPNTLAGALQSLCEETGKIKILAGGTDLIVQMRSDVIAPTTIVDIKHIPELTDVVFDYNSIHVGAAVSGASLNENLVLKKEWPGIVEAAELIGSTQIQGRATLGGNLCNGSPAADTVPALIAGNAVARIASKNGVRQIPVEQFIIGPGKTVLARDEILVSIGLFRRTSRSGDSYLRFIPRTEMDIAAVGVGINITLDEADICVSARVSLGAVAEKPILVESASDILIGSKLEEPIMKEVSEVVMKSCRPIDDKRGTKEFRTHVAGILVNRAARIAFERARFHND